MIHIKEYKPKEKVETIDRKGKRGKKRGTWKEEKHIRKTVETLQNIQLLSTSLFQKEEDGSQKIRTIGLYKRKRDEKDSINKKYIRKDFYK